ncbi:MAG: polyprenyl synthetase family protein [Phycisphaera sp.]|nr:polyprenyl synthetase family protein [Phycisphaera sp.]
MLLVTHTDKAIAQKLDADLAEVERLFRAELDSDVPCVNELVAHVERYRGKMLRPMLVMVCGMATGELTQSHRVIAAVVEMVHMATLVHDDVLDEAKVRRKGATINALRGNESAVMLGDYLISHAYHLCSSLNLPGVSRAIAQATNTVCEGELLQLANRNNLDLDEATYFDIIRRKTASLCGVCCRLGVSLHVGDDDGGEVADIPDERAGALFNYGEKVGTAFQIVDDLLDITGSEDTVGKTLGRDIEKGKLTLPLIRHLQKANPELRTALRGELALRGSTNGQSIRRVRELIAQSGAVESAQQRAAQLIEQAKHALELLHESPARKLLADMADAVLTRRF